MIVLNECACVCISLYALPLAGKVVENFSNISIQEWR